MIANYHTHTPRCNHAWGAEEEYVERALEAGLKILGFSDHSPQFFPGDYYLGVRMRPEQLQDYMKVTNPGIWMVLAAVIALLVGLIACSALGTLETTLDTRAEAKDGVVTVTLGGDESVEPGMVLRLDGREASIDRVYADDAGRTLCTAALDVPDGGYDAQIVTDTVSPIRFLID